MCTCLLHVLIGQSCLAEKQFEKGLGTDYVRVRKSSNSQDMLAVLREEQEGSIIAGGLIWNKYVLAAQATKPFGKQHITLMYSSLAVRVPPVSLHVFTGSCLCCLLYIRDQAVTSFEAGLQYDPDAAMLYWGLSHARGALG